MSKKIIFVISFLAVFGFLFNFGLPDAKAMTAIELQKLIEQLQRQITQLQQQLDKTQTQAEVWCHDFKVDLRYGDKGSEVSALQTALKKEGFTINKREIGDAYFGNWTASAVVGFQEKYRKDILARWGLEHGTGFVGPTTRAKLNELYGCKPVKPYIKVLSPNGGEKLEIGKSYDITWSSKGIDRVTIFLADFRENYPVTWHRISPDLSATLGKYSWKVADCYDSICNFTPGEKYKIKVSESATSPNYPVLVEDESDNYFSIVGKEPKPDLVVTDISWRPSNPTDEDEICIFATIKNIGTKAVDGSTLTAWTYINGYHAANTFYGKKIGIGDTLTEKILCSKYGKNVWFRKGKNTITVEIDPKDVNIINESNESNNKRTEVFTISSIRRSITVISPNGGEKWEKGKTYKITWSTEGLFSATTTSTSTVPEVEVTLFKGSRYYKFLTTLILVGSTGGYSWTVPLDIPAGDDYKIRVRYVSYYGTGDVPIEDFSDNYFSIVSATTTCHTSPLWSWNYCSPNCPCAEGEGDCDTDADCQAGLYCAQNVGAKYGQSKYMDVCEKKELKPDLTIKDIYYEGSYYIKVKYCNVGSGSSTDDFLIKLRNEDTGKEYPGNSYYRFKVPAPGKCAVTGGYTCSLIGLSYGERATVSAIIDWENRVDESNENNNVLTKTIGKAKKFITVISPNGGETWVVGNTYEIKWDYSKISDVDSNGLISLRWYDYENQDSYTLVNDYSLSAKSFKWTPTKEFVGNKLKISIIGDILSDESDNYFSIVGKEDVLAQFSKTDYEYDPKQLQIFGNIAKDGKTYSANLDGSSDDTYTTSYRYCPYDGKYHYYPDAWDIERKYVSPTKYKILVRGNSDADCGKGQPQNTGWIKLNPKSGWRITEVNKCSVSSDTYNSNSKLIDTYCKVDKKQGIIEWQSGSTCGGCCSCPGGASVNIEVIVEKGVTSTSATSTSADAILKSVGNQLASISKAVSQLMERIAELAKKR